MSNETINTKYVVYAYGKMYIAGILGIFDTETDAIDFTEKAKFDNDGYHKLLIMHVGYNISPDLCPKQFEIE